MYRRQRGEHNPCQQTHSVSISIQLLFFHSQAVTSCNNAKGTKSPTDSKSRTNSALPQKDEIQWLCSAYSPLRSDRNRRRQQSAFMCTDVAEPGCSSGGEQLGSPFSSPAKCNSLRCPLSRSSQLDGALCWHRNIWGQHGVIRGALPEEPLGVSRTQPELVTHSSLPRTLAVFPYKSPCYQAQLNPFHREMKQVSNPRA